MTTIRTSLNALEPGYARSFAVLNETGAGVREITVYSKADRLALFLSITAITGTCSVEVFTLESQESNIGEYPVASFPIQSAPSSNYLRIVTPMIVSPFLVRITWTGTLSANVVGKAVNSIEANDIIEVSIGDKATPAISSSLLTTANLWYTITVPTGCRDFELIAEPTNPARLDVRYDILSSEFWPVPAGNMYKEEFLASGAVTSFQVRSPNKANVTVRLKFWLEA